MRPEFAVGIPETITDIIAGISFALAIIALQKDAHWQAASEKSKYFQPLLTWIEENSGENEMTTVQRDIFYQVVVTVFIAPAVIHLTIHLVLTIARKYPEDDDDVDELDTPEEDFEYLNATPIPVLDSPGNEDNQDGKASGDQDEKTFTRWLGQLMCLNPKKNSIDSSHSSQPRKSTSLPGKFRSQQNVTQNLGKNSASTPNVYSHSKPRTESSQKNPPPSPVSNSKTVLKTNQAPGKALDSNSPGINGISSDNSVQADRASQEQNLVDSFSHLGEVETKFINPRLLKLLLMAAIIFECMLAFSASYYQYTELIQFDDYLYNKTLISKLDSSNKNMRMGVLMLASCRAGDHSFLEKLRKLPELEKERDELHVCQDFRAKAWVVVLCIIYGISGLITTVVIYGQYRDTLALTYGGQYPVLNRRLNKRRRDWGSADASTQDAASDPSRVDFMVVSPEEMQKRIRRDSFSEDEKIFSGYTVGMDVDSVIKFDGGSRIA